MERQPTISGCSRLGLTVNASGSPTGRPGELGECEWEWHQALRSCCVRGALTYLVDLSEVDAALPEHVAWLDQQYADGVFIASGRQVPRVGGLILVAGTNREDLERRLALDPFGRLGLAEHAVIEFVPPESLAVSSSCSDSAPIRRHRKPIVLRTPELGSDAFGNGSSYGP